MRVGLDIGGTKTVGVVLDAGGSILATHRMPTGRGNAEVAATAIAVIEELAQRSRVPSSSFTSIGIGIPGVVDAKTGEVSHAVNLGLTRLSLRHELAAHFAASVAVENDVNAAAVGVWHLLADPTLESMAYLNLGTGLAAGLVLDGRLRRGSRGTAGEIGHIPVDPHGPPCACGQFGCLELSASGAAIARLWPGAGDRALPALLGAAAAGDADAAAARDTLVANIAAAVRVLVLTIDVDVVVIGGGMISAESPLIAAVQDVLDVWASRSPFIHSLELSSRVRYAPSAGALAAIGAAHLATPGVLSST
ncbi:ROK family protein [Microbacterium sp. P07]|uniref:ROK family protein n=1 Tax=Microbacterium sp. P07 TaxID=3366952 RepID=UPI003746263B